IVFAVLVVATSVVAFIVIRNVTLNWKITPLTGSAPVNNPITVDGTPGAALQPMDGPTPVPWDGNSRVTILLIGLDYDWQAGGGYQRSDSMILLTVDPITMTAGMLSIPRDMWVNIPGFDYNKINTAYFLGDANKLPGGGPALAVQTVEEFLGVPINYYARVDYNTFVRIVDELDGIVVKPFEDVTIEPNDGSQKEQELKEGKAYTLDGKLALAYARARYTEGGDFSRARRQQQVIMAIRDRVLKWDLLPKLIAKSSTLYEEVSSGVSTNMNLTEIISLAQLVLKIPEDNIKKAVISPQDAPPDMTADGQSIDRPIPERIRLVRDEIFATTGPVAPSTVTNGGDPLELAKLENARISIQNGTAVTGLAEKTGGFLTGKGLQIIDQSSAAQATGSTTIYMYNSKPYTQLYLASLFQVPNSRIIYSYDPNAPADIVVVIGNDWATKNPME
ncbi:MAG: LCP family protein, partial [Anaerolineaceae bacterium]|nr:LCP family protein [Anaerolineaceae bacterium]